MNFFFSLKKVVTILKQKINEVILISKSNDQIFRSIYMAKKWRSNQVSHSGYNSGSGSDDVYSLPYINKVSEYVRENKISSIIDIGCGDFRVGRKLLECCNVKYLGVECFQDIVDYNNANYGSASATFKKIDFTQPNIKTETYELALVRQVLQHLDNRSIESFLVNLKPFQHIIITEHQTNKPKVFNKNIHRGSSNRTEKGSGVYLDKEPFKKYIYHLDLLITIPFDSDTSINSYAVTIKPEANDGCVNNK